MKAWGWQRLTKVHPSVLSGLKESLLYLQSKDIASILRDITISKLRNDSGVILRIRDDGDASMVLGSSTQKSDTTNVNLLNSLGNGDTLLGNGFLERIQIADNNIDLFNVLFGKILFITLNVTSEDTYCKICQVYFTLSLYVSLKRIIILTSMNCRMQGLYTSTKHFWGLGDFRNIAVNTIFFRACTFQQVRLSSRNCSEMSIIIFM